MNGKTQNKIIDVGSYLNCGGREGGLKCDGWTEEKCTWAERRTLGANGCEGSMSYIRRGMMAKSKWRRGAGCAHSVEHSIVQTRPRVNVIPVLKYIRS